MLGMRRRVWTYDSKFADWNLFISLSAFVLGAATLIFVYKRDHLVVEGEPAPDNPWRALTIEWQVSSPPPVFNFDGAPRVVGGPYNYGQPGASTSSSTSRRWRRRTIERARRKPRSRRTSGRLRDGGHLDRVMLGLIVALASEFMLFGAFFTAFFYIRYTNYPVYPPEPFEMRWTPPHQHGDPGLVVVTMHWALVSIKRGNRRGLTLGLLFTLIMGLTFLALQIREYNLLHTEASRPSTGPSPASSSVSPACTASTSWSARSCSRSRSCATLRGH